MTFLAVASDTLLYFLCFSRFLGLRGPLQQNLFSRGGNDFWQGSFFIIQLFSSEALFGKNLFRSLDGSWMVLGWFLGVIVDENPRTMSQHKNLASEAPQRLNKEGNMSISKKFDWISVYFSWIDNISDGSWRFLVVLGVFAQKQGVCRNIALPLECDF